MQTAHQLNVPSAEDHRIPDMKTFDLCQKYRLFAHNVLHPMIHPKLDDNTIREIKEQQQNADNKRLQKS